MFNNPRTTWPIEIFLLFFSFSIYFRMLVCVHVFVYLFLLIILRWSNTSSFWFRCSSSSKVFCFVFVFVLFVCLFQLCLVWFCNSLKYINSALEDLYSKKILWALKDIFSDKESYMHLRFTASTFTCGTWTPVVWHIVIQQCSMIMSFIRTTNKKCSKDIYVM